MSWHFAPIVLHGRRYTDGRSYEARDEFATIITVQLLGGNRAYVCGFLNNGEEGPLSKQDLLEVAADLRAKYGVTHIDTERHAKPRTYTTGFGDL